MKTLFPIADYKPERRKPRKMMRLVEIDGVESCGCDYEPSDVCGAIFECKHCGVETAYVPCTYQETKTGIPCPDCNEGEK